MNDINQKFSEKDLKILEEGTTKFYLYPSIKKDVPSKSMAVFYNEKMEINRDITNLAVQAYNKLINKNPLVVVDSMAASGIGSIRMLKECENIKKIYINDINTLAVELIHKNIQLNDLNELKSLIEISNNDSNLLLLMLAQLTQKEKPDIISIDPFGTPNCYLDPVFKAIKKENAMICITATDTPVLFGVRVKACQRKYMSKPLNNEFHKEIGARILLYFISRIANINNLGIHPLLTLYSNHFVRVFALTYKSKERIFETIKNYGNIIYCKHCGNRYWKDLNGTSKPNFCRVCSTEESLDFAGPLWLGKIHEKDFITKLIELNENCDYKSKNRLRKILTIVSEEIEMPISYYNLHGLCKELKHKSVPKIEKVIDEIKKNGFKASRTHFDFLSIKTDMNLSELKNLLISL